MPYNNINRISVAVTNSGADEGPREFRHCKTASFHNFTDVKSSDSVQLHRRYIFLYCKEHSPWAAIFATPVRERIEFHVRKRRTSAIFVRTFPHHLYHHIHVYTTQLFFPCLFFPSCSVNTHCGSEWNALGVRVIK